MTWREQLIARILLLIARMVADEPDLERELRNLSNAIVARHVTLAEDVSS